MTSSINNGGSSEGFDGFGVHQGTAMHHSIEAADGVGSVQHSTHCAVGLHQAVAALDDVSAAALLLALSVAGQSVSNIVGEGILGVRVIFGAGLWDNPASNCGHQETQHDDKLEDNDIDSQHTVQNHSQAVSTATRLDQTDLGRTGKTEK
jgi:hypothetical protein